MNPPSEAGNERAPFKTGNAIPIIVLPGSDDPELEDRALAAGVRCVLRKACNNAVLLECIQAAFCQGE